MKNLRAKSARFRRQEPEVYSYFAKKCEKLAYVIKTYGSDYINNQAALALL